MSNDPAVTRLARFVAAHPKSFALPEHLDRAADAVLDTLGCMLLGHDAPVTRSALAACRPWGSGPSPVPGTGVSLPAPWAALAGGAAAHAYDLDDYTLVANDHPSAVMVPALLSEAAMLHQDVTGADLLEAYLIGLEVIFRAGEALNMGHYNTGWHTTSTLDSLGASAAVARLTGLNPEQTAAALSLTTSLGSGFVSQFGTMAKPLHAGISAKAGLVSCALARSGATASAEVLDGAISMAGIMTPPDAVGFDAALDGLGETWGLDRFGLGAKLYPSCGYTHRAIDGALELRDRLGAPSPEEIEAVDLSLPDFHLAILPYGVPETPDQALFSAPWCAAVALATGACRSADFTAEGLARPDILALTTRTTARARMPINPAINLDPDDPDSVVVTLTNGRRETAEVALWTGAPGRDLGRSGLLAKYTENGRTDQLDEHRCSALASAVLDLPAAASLSQLFQAVSDLSP